MKRIGIFLVFFLINAFALMSQTVSINDTAFLNALIDLGVDTDSDGLISYTEAGETTSLWISEREISDLTGIEAFLNLDTLDCERNQLTTLDLSNNNSLVFLNLFLNQLNTVDISGNILLEVVHCDYNPLVSLDPSKNLALKVFSCRAGDLVSLDVSENQFLEELDCSSNDLTNLELPGNSSIKHLYCDFNQLNQLDISGESSLLILTCRGNQLSNLDLAKNPLLEELHCDFNQLSTMDVSKNTFLELIHCDGNKLSSLFVNGGALKSLDCDFNELDSLDVSACTSLVTLNCGSNSLTALEVSNNIALDLLNCGGNSITHLDLANNVALTTLNCSSNDLDSLDLTRNTLLTHIYMGYNSIVDVDFYRNVALQILSCAGNQLTSLDLSQNRELIELYCNENNLSSLSVNNNPALRLISCSNNPLSNLDISNLTNFFLQDGTCGCGGYLDLSNIPSLNEVCVWITPFPQPDSIWSIFTGGSPDLYFKDCAAPALSVSDDLPYQPASIEASITEEGRIYLVPENTDGSLENILADSIKSVRALANTSVSIPLEGLNNGIYWLYGADMDDNISNPEEFSILGVGIEEVTDSQFEIYPNPTESLLTIESKDLSPRSIELINLNGQLVFSTNIVGAHNQIDLSSFEKGVYFLSIISKERVASQKVIKL